MDECGGVVIRFPPEGSGSDKVSIRGPKDCVQKAKQQLIELSNEKTACFFPVLGSDGRGGGGKAGS